ncbi:MAG: ATP-binding cassette domain-containing protein [Gammaproteobacteria bacterium]|nr:ATP-binding cassette domain-containing protein [Gammaproteobacteria bacterium]
MTGALIEASGLRFAFGEQAVLDGVEFTVRAGEIYGLVGADGAGKTTLLRIVAGQLPMQEGDLSVLGKNPRTPELRDDIAYMPQGFGLYRDLSVVENMAFFADLHGLSSASAQQKGTSKNPC